MELKGKSQSLVSIWLFLLLFLGQEGIYGQGLRSSYPVQVSVFLKPPYSLHLDDYCTSSSGKLQLSLLNRDLLQPEADVRLHIRINAGNKVILETLPQKQLPTFRLVPGAPYVLSPGELCPYFQLENLQASAPFTGRFPEGMLEVCISVMEANTGHQLSQATCARAWITLNRPPLLSLPLKETRFPLREPQHFLFQWTPRHQGLAQVEYELVLKELLDTQVSPQDAFAYSQEVFSTRVSGTSFAYTVMNPPLFENTNYAWQVRAIAREGVEEVNIFDQRSPGGWMGDEIFNSLEEIREKLALIKAWKNPSLVNPIVIREYCGKGIIPRSQRNSWI